MAPAAGGAALQGPDGGGRRARRRPRARGRQSAGRDLRLGPAPLARPLPRRRRRSASCSTSSSRRASASTARSRGSCASPARASARPRASTSPRCWPRTPTLLRNSHEAGANHRVELELEPPAATLLGDRDQISQIFWNLARNALRAMPDGGTLAIRGELAGDALPARFQRHRARHERGAAHAPVPAVPVVLRPAAPASAWRSSTASSTSTAAGSRSTASSAREPRIRVELPVGATPVAAAAVGIAGARRWRRRSVLIVDDERSLVDFLTAALRRPRATT